MLEFDSVVSHLYVFVRKLLYELYEMNTNMSLFLRLILGSRIFVQYYTIYITILYFPIRQRTAQIYNFSIVFYRSLHCRQRTISLPALPIYLYVHLQHI